MGLLAKSLFTAALGLGCLSLAGAQAPPPPPVASIPAIAPAAVSPSATLYTVPAQATVPDASEYRLQQGIGNRIITMMYLDSNDTEAVKLAKQIADAKSDTDKDKLKEKLKDMLNKGFDERQKQHEKQLEALEAQVKKLKDMVTKRQDNKKEIIDERIKQLTRDAQGLGW